MKTFKWEVSEGNFFYPSQIYGSKHYSLWQVWNNFTKSLHDYHARSRISKYPIKNCHYEIQVNTDAVVRRCSVEKVFLKISQNIKENYCARVSFLKKLQALGLIFLLKMGLRHRCFPVNFAKLLRTPFLQNTLRPLFPSFVVKNNWNDSPIRRVSKQFPTVDLSYEF